MTATAYRARDFMDWDAVFVDLNMGPTATIASVEFMGHTAVGEAKRMPTDVHSEDVAVALAVGRALETLSEQGIARRHRRGYRWIGGLPRTHRASAS